MKITYPDYDNSILSVTSSILKHYGAENRSRTLPQLDSLLEKSYRNVVILVLDGLGVNVLEKNLSENSFFRRHMLSEISSVYPCTTTTAITSITSGRTPMEHGWVGWSCYFKEINKCVDLFSGNLSGVAEGVAAGTEHIPLKYLGYENIFSQIGKASGDGVQTFNVSPFSEYFADTFSGVCVHLEQICRKDGEKFIYAYHFQPDYDMHDFGTTAECVKRRLDDFDARLKCLANKLSDTLLIITADHGMIDITMKCIEDYPQLLECLRLPISMEPRCCSFFVREEFKQVFPKRFRDAFSDKFMLFTHDEFLRTEFLGNGQPHKKTVDFVGDYVATAVSDIALWYKDNHGEFNDFRASHAGLCEEEMLVPLIVYEAR